MLKNARERDRQIDIYVYLHYEEVDGMMEVLDMYNQMHYTKQYYEERIGSMHTYL